MNLSDVIYNLAETTHAFSDVDLDQDWAWGPHREGVRFALIGAYHECRELAVILETERERLGRPLTQAQRILGQVHAAYRDLTAVVLGVDDELYSREPAPAEWPLRFVLGHIAGTQRHFYTLVHYGLRRQREGSGLAPRLPEGEVDEVMGPVDELEEIMEHHGLAEMMAYLQVFQQQFLADFAGISDAELEGPSLWWEEIAYPLRHRLQRFDAHLRQHTVQAEKTLAALGQEVTEAKRLLRLLFNALAEVEAKLIGEPDIGLEALEEAAAKIASRAEEIAGLVAQTRLMAAAVRAGDEPGVAALLAGNPALANTLDPAGLPVVLTAVYHGQRAIAWWLVEAGAELDLHSGAALGRLDIVQREAGSFPQEINEVSRDGFTPLQLACYFGHAPVALWLLAQGADLSAVSQNDSHLQAIHAAAAHGDVDLCQVLLEAGADANARQAGGFTPIHAAAQNGNLPLVRLLALGGADLGAETADGRTAAALAHAAGHAAVVAYLEDAGGESGD